MQKNKQNNQSARNAGPKHRWYFYAGSILLTAAVLIVGFLLFLTATEYRPAATETASSGKDKICPVMNAEKIRIASFNTGYAGLGWESDFLMDGGKGTGADDKPTVDKNMTGISKILRKVNADIYMLQEVDLKSHRTFQINQLDAYASVLPEHQWYYGPNYVCKYVPYPIQAPIGEIHSGVATYSRYLVEQAQRISLPVPFSWPVRTANLKRCMLETRLPIENSDASLVILNFHLEAYDTGEGKQAQTKQLLEIIQNEYNNGNYVIAGGDFNQIFPEVKTAIKPTSQWVPGNLDPLPESWNGWQYVYDGSVPTCRLLNQPYTPEDPLTQHYVIDGFIVSPNLKILNVKTLDEQFRFSDHNPVVMDIALK